MTIKLVPITPVTIDILALRLTAEEKYDAQKWQEFENKPAELINITPITITNLNILSVFFNIPEKSAINSKDVKIYAFANNKPYNSDPFEINFAESTK